MRRILTLWCSLTFIWRSNSANKFWILILSLIKFNFHLFIHFLYRSSRLSVGILNLYSVLRICLTPVSTHGQTGNLNVSDPYNPTERWSCDVFELPEYSSRHLLHHVLQNIWHTAVKEEMNSTSLIVSICLSLHTVSTGYGGIFPAELMRPSRLRGWGKSQKPILSTVICNLEDPTVKIQNSMYSVSLTGD